MKSGGYAIIALLLVITAIVFIALQAVEAPLFLDDLDELNYISNVRPTGQSAMFDCYGLIRPVKNLFFLTVDRFHPDNLAYCHYGMMIIYIAATVLLVLVSYCLLKNWVWSVALAALWALSPTKVSSLVWLSCGNLLIMVVLLLAALLSYEKSQNRQSGGWKWLILTGLLFSASILSYESVIILPLLLILWDAVKGRSINRKRFKYYLPFWIVALGYFAYRVMTISRSGAASSGFSETTSVQISLSSAWIMLDHLQTWLFPFGRQEVLGTYVWGTTVPVWIVVVSWAVILLLIYAAYRFRKTNPMFGFGIVWFFCMMLPISNLIPLKNGPYADYYLLVPSIGLALALTAILRRLWQKFREKTTSSRLGVMITAITIIVCWRMSAAFISPAWARSWADPEILLERSLSVRIAPYRAGANLARSRLMAGDEVGAEQLALKARKEAPGYFLSYTLLASTYLSQERYNEAYENLVDANRLQADEPFTCFALAYIFEHHFKDRPRAVKWYQKVVAQGPNKYSANARERLKQLASGHP